MTKRRKTKDEKNKMVRFTRKVVQHSTGRWHQNVKKIMMYQCYDLSSENRYGETEKSEKSNT